MSASCETPKSMNGGARAFGGVIAVVALISGVAAVILPMGERISSLERQFTAAMRSLHDEHAATFDRVEEQISDHKGLYAHPEGGNDIGRIQEKFAEVEAQFRGAKELSLQIQKTNERRLDVLEKTVMDHDRLVVSHRQELKALEAIR